MDEKRIDVRSWQVGLAGLIVGAVVFAGILGLWRPWEKLPPIGEVRGAILEADIKQIQKLTAQLAKDPIQSMELLETGAIEVTIERTLEFFTFELVGGKWTKTSSGYFATSMGPAGGFAPPPAEIVNHAPISNWDSVATPVEMAPTSAEFAPTPVAPPPPRALSGPGIAGGSTYTIKGPRDFAQGQDRIVPIISPRRSVLPPPGESPAGSPDDVPRRPLPGDP